MPHRLCVPAALSLGLALRPSARIGCVPLTVYALPLGLWLCVSPHWLCAYLPSVYALPLGWALFLPSIGCVFLPAFPSLRATLEVALSLRMGCACPPSVYALGPRGCPIGYSYEYGSHHHDFVFVLVRARRAQCPRMNAVRGALSTL